MARVYALRPPRDPDLSEPLLALDTFVARWLPRAQSAGLGLTEEDSSITTLLGIDWFLAITRRDRRLP
jgi:hypothetical protein